MANEKRTYSYDYKTISISCKAKDLLEEIGKLFAEKNKDSLVYKPFNRGVFVSELIEEAYEKMKEE
jgi:hypothetical protein